MLLALAEVLARADASGSGIVLSCSALKRSYRELLRANAHRLRFVHLHGRPALLEERLKSRAGHYMPVSLLQSQLDTLEPPGLDENAITVDIGLTPAEIVDVVVRQLGQGA